MATLITEILLVVASYLGVVIIVLMGVNWILGGLFKPYMRVRGSRGKLILVKIKNMASDYFVTGQVDERVLTFKDRKKQARMIILPNQRFCIYRSIGVSCIDVDDEKNAVLTYNNDLVTGFDAVKFNDIYERALYKPEIVDTKTIIIIVLCIVILLACIILGVLIWQDHKLLVQLTQIKTDTITTLAR